MLRRALLTACLLATAAAAQEPNTTPYLGTWAPDVKLCKGGNFHWVFTPTEAHNEAFSCEHAVYQLLEPGRWDVHMTLAMTTNPTSRPTSTFSSRTMCSNGKATSSTAAYSTGTERGVDA